MKASPVASKRTKNRISEHAKVEHNLTLIREVDSCPALNDEPAKLFKCDAPCSWTGWLPSKELVS